MRFKVQEWCGVVFFLTFAMMSLTKKWWISQIICLKTDFKVGRKNTKIIVRDLRNRIIKSLFSTDGELRIVENQFIGFVLKSI